MADVEGRAVALVEIRNAVVIVVRDGRRRQEQTVFELAGQKSRRVIPNVELDAAAKIAENVHPKRAEQMDEVVESGVERELRQVKLKDAGRRRIAEEARQQHLDDLFWVFQEWQEEAFFVIGVGEAIEDRGLLTAGQAFDGGDRLRENRVRAKLVLQKAERAVHEVGGVGRAAAVDLE
jgi:hypothetical protein